jgi:predicted Zn-dependent peptidase
LSQQIHHLTLPNGMILVAEVMDWVESAAFTLVNPSGSSRDPAEQWGLANFTCEMAQRGANGLTSRQIVEQLDRLGADRSAAVTAAHTSFAAATLSEKLKGVLEIYAGILQRPNLPADQLDDARQVCLQELQAVEDDLSQRTMQALRQKAYGDPWGRASQGTVAAIESIQLADVQQFFETNYRPQGTVLAVAGKFDWQQLQDDVAELFGDWQGAPAEVVSGAPPSRDYLHLPEDSSQTQIGVSFPSIPYRDDDYFQVRGAVGVLSDGMSSRLFTEVRENRGLCYTVYAMHHSLRDRGSVLCYSGTSSERAQETLDVLIAEIVKLADGIQPAELDRLKARTKSALIMQQESSGARAGAIAGDWYHLGRVRTMDEIDTVIGGLTCESINAYLREHPPRDFTIVTLGSQPLENPVEVS